MDAEERISSLHERMKVRRQEKKRRITVISGAVSFALAFCILAPVMGRDSARSGGIAGLYSGATMIFDDVGGYVLVAILSFAAAVILTAVCIRRQRAKQDNKIHDEETKREEQDHESQK